MSEVIFHPYEVAVEVESGTSILDAARRAHLPIRNDCGGEGVCGKCRVEIQRGEVNRLSTRHQLPPGQDLACRVLVMESTVEVFVPEETRELKEEVSLRQEQPFPEELPAEHALVTNVEISLPEPSLDDNRADAERLIGALNRLRPASYHISLQVLRGIPQAVRQARWRPQATLAVTSCGADVLQVSSGAARRPLILAVDVGTTVLKARLIAPQNGWSASCYNSQAMYGPDVISRIIYCQENERGLSRLQELVAADMNRLLASMLQRSQADRNDIWAVVAAGNTTMMHLLLGMVPLWIRREPYVGCAYQPPPMPADGLGIEINPGGVVYCLSSVSAYVGADISAGVLATGLYNAARPWMLIDLGTNGEIVIGSREFMVCCSASAGPAFEGGGSTSGSRARPGAISTVWWDEQLRWKTMGGQKPVGICGTGYIDLIAALLRAGVIDKTGRFRPGSSDALRQREDESLEYVVAEAELTATGRDIVVTQADIDNLVRAKAAIYAAARVLLESLGMTWHDLERVMLAGGFGESLEVRNAIAIGLLPEVPLRKIEFVGNTSLKGAILAAIEADNYWKAREIAAGMTYFELSTHPAFMEEFVSASFLPHTNMEQFPSIKPVTKG